MFLLLLTVLSLGVIYADVNMNSDLIGRTMHVETLSYRGYWLDAHRSSWMRFTGAAEKDVYKYLWTKLKVVKCGSHVCIESIRYPNYYLDAHHSRYVGLTHSYHPANQNWAQWDILCTDNSMAKCKLQSLRYNNECLYPYHVFHTSAAIGSGKGSWCDLRILAPKPSDYYTTILSTENQSGVAQKKTITITEGVTNTDTTETKISATTTKEITAAYEIVSAKQSTTLSAEWKKVSTKTFQQSTQIKYELVIPARSRVDFKQLTGTYGPFRIAAKRFQVVTTALKASDPLVRPPSPPLDSLITAHDNLDDKILKEHDSKDDPTPPKRSDANDIVEIQKNNAKEESNDMESDLLGTIYEDLDLV